MDAQATFSCSFTQSDLGPAAELPNLPLWPAQRLLPQERQELAVQVLAGAQPVAELAQQHEVSRTFRPPDLRRMRARTLIAVTAEERLVWGNR